jgi:hypothetical protein
MCLHRVIIFLFLSYKESFANFIKTQKILIVLFDTALERDVSIVTSA